MTKRARSPAQRARREKQLFYRWLWFVYVPLGLAPVGIVLGAAHLLPGATVPLLFVLLAYDAVCVRLVVERRRRGVAVPVPRTLIAGIGALLALVLSGVVLMWMGVDRLGGNGGPPLLVTGAFLLLLALFAPAFKVVDLALRTVARSVLRQRRQVVPQRQRTVA
jgi:hypothetical protein